LNVQPLQELCHGPHRAAAPCDPNSIRSPDERDDLVIHDVVGEQRYIGRKFLRMF
jgi:hypothetical protein